MRQMKKKSIILLVGVFVISFFVSMALLWTPQITSTIDTENYEVLYTLNVNDVAASNACVVNKNGFIDVTGGDSFVIFTDLQESGRLVRLNFQEPIQEETLIEIYINDGFGFNEGRKYGTYCQPGDTSAIVCLGDCSYIQMRVDVNMSYTLGSLEICDVEVIENGVVDNTWWSIYAVIIALLLVLAMYFIDKKYDIAESLVVNIEFGIKLLKKNFLSILIMGVVSGVVVLLLLGRPVVSVFYAYQAVILAVFVFLVLTAIRIIWSYRQDLVGKFEKVFVLVLLVAGIAMIVVSPMARISWDMDAHYRLALEASYLGDVKVTKADDLIINNHIFSHVQLDPTMNYNNARVFNAHYEDVIAEYKSGISLAHIPSGVFIAIGRLLGLPFTFIFRLGKIANLLIYAAVCYLALKKLKSGKLILAAIALFPTSILLACTYSYDYWVTAFSLLGMAYFVGELQDTEHAISIKNTIIMCGALGLACIPKKIYFPLLLIPFLMPQKKIDNKKKYYLVCVLALIVTVLLFMEAAAGQTTGAGDTRGGSTIGPADQLAFIFGDIFGYAFILLKFLFTEYLTIANMENYLTLYPYLTEGVGAGILLVIILLAFLFDKEENGATSNWLSRIYVILMYFGGSALVATSLYVAFTPVGHETVLGCQARYIVPWIYPLLGVLSMNKIKSYIPKKAMYWIVTVGCFGVLFINLAMVFLPAIVSV